ncbi:ferredoxin [Rhizobium sp. 'Codium 1']|uniref:ferredoxin n=1 Tax=Rhizobium sp. 'Codium 1' TaxID=2940484 RepID=UPI001E2FB962|nr:ferredoxin [Rhizobium sp. 'Codium 1']MCC8933413.1 ferredoxin [Rhizobium sp. 'Codium 1']
MSGPSSVLTEIDARLAAFGLSCRGVLRFGDGEPAALLGDDGPVSVVVLVGVAGGAMWPIFSAWREAQADGGGADPLDRWSKFVIADVAAQFGASACYPSEPPYQPFQRWAMQAEGLKASPLGILIHPQYGLWHSYRGALLFRNWGDEIGAVGKAEAHPCDRCFEKPCLSACPAGAVSENNFDVARCRQHLVTAAGQGGCMVSGCLARNACPVGVQYRYPDAQLRFHMQALTLPG